MVVAMAEAMAEGSSEEMVEEKLTRLDNVGLEKREQLSPHQLFDSSKLTLRALSDAGRQKAGDSSTVSSTGSNLKLPSSGLWLPHPQGEEEEMERLDRSERQLVDEDILDCLLLMRVRRVVRAVDMEGRASSST
mmetsp:Transcript_5302/g.11408  ORF Transcript_5302/g.11408 Transcript_5302/m.11408 type:complete len:134 (-) Transcript_5302:1235-1636(-)